MRDHNRFVDSYRKIARMARLPGWEAENKRSEHALCSLVHEWLKDETRRWLMILDNNNDAEMLFTGRMVDADEGAANNPVKHSMIKMPLSLPVSFS